MHHDDAMPARRPLLALSLLIPLALLSLVGCSSGATTAAAGAPTTSTSAPGAGGFTAFRDCMAKHGVTLAARGRGGPPGGAPDASDPGSGRPARPPVSLPAGVTQAQMDAASKACAGSRPLGAGAGGVNASAFRAYLSCLADHGVAVSTSTSTTAKTATTASSGSGGGRRQGFDRNDPNFAAADAACAALRPAGGPGSFGSTSTTEAAR